MKTAFAALNSPSNTAPRVRQHNPKPCGYRSNYRRYHARVYNNWFHPNMRAAPLHADATAHSLLGSSRAKRLMQWSCLLFRFARANPDDYACSASPSGDAMTTV